MLTHRNIEANPEKCRAIIEIRSFENVKYSEVFGSTNNSIQVCAEISGKNQAYRPTFEKSS